MAADAASHTYFQLGKRQVRNRLATEGAASTYIPGSERSRNMLITFVLVLATSFAVCMCGSCREANLCCVGRDSSCVVQKSPVNAVTEKPCYCDHACLKLGDCCFDFKTACGVVDCHVTDWSEWTACSANCGPGTTTRRRTVLTAPENGGKHCPMLEQTRSCHGSHCPHHIRAVLKETAMLLPIALAYSRRTNDTALDIQKNLINSQNTTIPLKTDYCVKFQVVKTTKSCKRETTYRQIKDGEAVCVLCESVAMRVDESPSPRCPGHGADSRLTHWEALSAPHCRGKWLRLTSALLPIENGSQVPCTLCDQGAQFIFVCQRLNPGESYLHM